MCMFDEFDELKRTVVKLEQRDSIREQQLTSLRQLFYAACETTVPTVRARQTEQLTEKVHRPHSESAMKKARDMVVEFVSSTPSAKRVEGFKRSEMSGLAEKHHIILKSQAVTNTLQEMRRNGELKVIGNTVMARYVVVNGVTSESQISTEPVSSSAAGTV